jgi:acetolactate synthase-1/2/3 large subunit
MDATPYLGDADAILVVECDVPWVPSLKAPPPECKVVHIGVDPLFSRYPIRGFPCDLAVTCTAATALPELSAVLDRRVDEAAVANRRQRGAEQRERLVALWLKTCENAANVRPIDMARASACIARVKPEDATLVNEYTLMPEHCGSNRPGS